MTKRFSIVRECNVFLQCCITLGPARQFSLQNVITDQLKLKLHELTMEN